ncbi:sensor histidine kinase [Clostridium vincentii]|uniref:Sensor protein CitS n=1 Tax=Clostridium vincentii TaxID=52704 RepID=A0A2T0BDE8_9CLOT|nr:GHKL domain-containing protein [Clostridium vincentii]PRR81921.1 Sensor protein CitS [Clostridium vincentii]
MLILSGIINCIAIFVSIKELGLVTINKKKQWYIMLIIGSLTIIGAYFSQSISLVLLFGSILIFLLLERNSILNSLVSIVIVLFITFILDIIIGSIFAKIIEYFNISGIDNFIVKLINCLVFLFFMIITSKRINKIAINLERKGFKAINVFKRKSISIIGCIAIIIIFFLNLFVINNSQTSYNFFALTITFAMSYLIIGVIIVFVIYKSMKSDVESKTREKELKTITIYNENLESLYTDMRKFRHDYVNILSSMASYMEEDDMTGLKEYFNKKIIPLGKDMNAKNKEIGLLHNIAIKEIKGVILTKIIQAQELGVEVIIDIAEIVEEVNLDVIDLSRCIGILIDNALEATVVCENGKLEIGFIKRNNAVMIVIENSVQGEAPPIHKLFQKGFSTKGEDRGLGLSTLREILSKYPKASLDTIIENNKFSQILEIY